MTEIDVQRRLDALFETSGAEAAKAVTRGDIARVIRRLRDVWHREQPGAIEHETIREDVFRRYKDLTARLAERRRAICAARPVEERTIIDPAPPSPETFFYGPLSWTTGGKTETPTSAESRLGIRLPALLRGLYDRQDCGMTDFVLATRVANAPLRFDGPKSSVQAYEIWPWVWPGGRLSPCHQLRSLGAVSDDMYEPDDAESFRSTTPEVDRLILLASHGFDEALCLDYRGRSEPAVVLLDIKEDPVAAFEAPDFDSFFHMLRREALIEEDGLRRRGLRELGDDED